MVRDYEKLTKAFNSDKINNRVDYLYIKANNFLKDRILDKYVMINRKILREIVIDYFADTNRIKDYLKSYKSYNPTFSYLGYWILRKKPLFLLDKKNYSQRLQKPFLEYINEWFTFHLILDNKYFSNEYDLFNDL